MSFRLEGHVRGTRWLSFRNDSSETAPAFAIMRITGVAEVQDHAVLKVNKPNADNGTKYVFNGPLDVPPGSFGSCTLSFPCAALYNNASTPAFGETWGAESGSWQIKKNKQGYTVLGDPADGRVYMIPQFGFSGWKLGKTSGSVSQDATDSIDIYSGTCGSESDTGENVDACNKFGAITGVTWVGITYEAEGNKWYITEARC